MHNKLFSLPNRNKFDYYMTPDKRNSYNLPLIFTKVGVTIRSNSDYRMFTVICIENNKNNALHVPSLKNRDSYNYKVNKQIDSDPIIVMHSNRIKENSFKKKESTQLKNRKVRHKTESVINANLIRHSSEWVNCYKIHRYSSKKVHNFNNSGNIYKSTNNMMNASHKVQLPYERFSQEDNCKINDFI